jgi:YVTN family beta-propeller protein
MLAIKLICLTAVVLAGCSSGESVFTGDDGGGSAPPRFTIGGTVTGLAVSGLVLQNNGADDLSIAGSGSFTFAMPLVSGSSFDVTIRSQPASVPMQSCSIVGGTGTGTVRDANVNSVEVTCATLIGKFFYVSNADSNDVSAYAIDAPTGALSEIAGSPFRSDASPGLSAADDAGKSLYVTNAGSPTVPPRLSVYSIDLASGVLRPAPHSPFDLTHPPIPPGALVLGKPLVLASSVTVYVGATTGALYGATTDIAGDLMEIPGMPLIVGVGLGLGTVNAEGTVIYLPHDNFNRMAAGGVTAYSVHSPSGVLTLLGSYPTGGRAPTMAVLSPAEKFLLVPNSNFGNERGSVAVFAVDAANGTLTAVAGSPFETGAATTPVSVAVHPKGTLLYATNSNGGNTSSVTAFEMDTSTGFLTPAPGSPFSTQGASATPGSIDPSGRFFFVSNRNSNSIQGFRIDPDSGALTIVPGAPFPTGLSPSAVSIDPSGKYLYCVNTRSNSVSAYAIDSVTGTLRPINTLPAGQSPRSGEQVGLQ